MASNPALATPDLGWHLSQKFGKFKVLSKPKWVFLLQVDIIEHKKDYCKLRFTCKCDYLNIDNDENNAASLQENQQIKNGNVLSKAFIVDSYQRL